MIKILVLSCGLAALLGFAAQRASICNVRAIAEVIGSGTAHMLVSFGKTVLWVLVVTIPYFWLVPSAGDAPRGWAFSELSMLGGFVFGAGAAMNGACAFSTLARLADGQLRMLGTLCGFIVGVVSCAALAGRGWLLPTLPAPAGVGLLVAWAGILGLGLSLWALYESIRLWRTRTSGVRFKELVLASPYRLSTAAMLIGLANGSLYLIYGSWAYTSLLQQSAERFLPERDLPMSDRWLLLAALFVGMAMATWQRRSFRLAWRPKVAWLRNVFGGILMGLGAAVIPGGNDALILYGIPSLSPHALPSYVALVAGIAAVLSFMRWGFGIEMHVECHNDECVASTIPPDEPAKIASQQAGALRSSVPSYLPDRVRALVEPAPHPCRAAAVAGGPRFPGQGSVWADLLKRVTR